MSLSSSRRSSKQKMDDGEFFLECKAAFLSIYDDVSDKIGSKKDLLTVLQQSGRNPSNRALEKHWPRHTDELSFNDFVDICRKEPVTTADDLMKAFRKIDINGDGYISLDELYKIMNAKGDSMSRDEVRRMIDEVDENKDGRLDYGEFCNMIMKTTNDCKKMSMKVMERKERRKKGKTRSDILDEMPKPSPRIRPRDQQKAKSGSKGRLPDPRSLRDWSMCTSKGSFFYEDDEIVTHVYSVRLSEDSAVYFSAYPLQEPQSLALSSGEPVDTALYILDSRGKLVTFTEQKDSRGRYGVKCDLSAGEYQIIPYTTGCRFKQRSPNDHVREAKLVKKDKDDKIVITSAFRKALEDIFDLCDLDDNGTMSKDEFNWFNLRTSGEALGEDEWEVVEERTSLENGEITKRGFIELNEMEAEDSQGDVEDLWITLTSMGLNKALIMDEACPFRVEVYVERSGRREPKFKCTGIESLQKKELVDEICQSVIEKSQSDPVKVRHQKDVTMHTYKNDHRATIALENRSRSRVNVEVDCNKSKNAVSHRDSLEHTVEVEPQSMAIAHHLVPAREGADWTVICT